VRNVFKEAQQMKCLRTICEKGYDFAISLPQYKWESFILVTFGHNGPVELGRGTTLDEAIAQAQKKVQDFQK
jgi:hypothetical protein